MALEDDDGDELVDLGISGTPQSAPVPLKLRRGLGDLIIPVLLGGVVIGSVLYLIRPVEVPEVAQKPPATKPAATSRPAIAEVAPSKPPVRSIFREPTKPVDEAPPDPRKQTEEWKNVEEAAASADAGRAIFIFEDYRSRNPGLLEEDLKKYTEATLDRLWWARLADLCRRRDALLDQIEKTNSEIAGEVSDEQKQRLVRAREAMEAQRAAAISAMTSEMGYTLKKAPDMHDSEEIGLLRKERDEALFKRWSEKVVRSARTRLGALPWERTR